MSVEQYIEKYYPDNNLIKCGFCGSVKKISNYTYTFKNQTYYISNVKHLNTLKVCNRPSKEVQCDRLKYNTNSKEYVKVAYETATLDDANKIILERNKSPFYRNNYTSDEEYIKAQKRGVEYYDSPQEYVKAVKKGIYSRSLEGYIDRFGPEGKEKWKEVQKKKDASSLKACIKLYGDVEGVRKFKEKNSKTVHTKENFLKRGKTEKDYNDYISKSAFSNTLPGFIKRYGDKKGKELYKEKSIKIGYANTFDYYKERYGDLGEEKYKEHLIKLFGNTGKRVKYRASKESMKNLFNELLQKIPDTVEYYIGAGDKKEYFLWDKELKKMSFYDFVIPKLKLIIEYNGSLWHYNKNFNYKENKIGPSLEELKSRDKYKRTLAETNGFTMIEVFDTDNFVEAINMILNEIDKRINDDKR